MANDSCYFNVRKGISRDHPSGERSAPYLVRYDVGGYRGMGHFGDDSDGVETLSRTIRCVLNDNNNKGLAREVTLKSEVLDGDGPSMRTASPEEMTRLREVLEEARPDIKFLIEHCVHV